MRARRNTREGARRNAKITPSQVFAAVLRDLKQTNPELAKAAYENSPYYLEFAEKHLAKVGAGEVTEDEIIDQIRFTGKGISDTDRKRVEACLAPYAWPQAKPADIMGLYMAWAEAEGTERERYAMLDIANRAHRYGYISKEPLEITAEDLHEMIGFPECEKLPRNGNQEHMKAYLRYFQSRWYEQAKKRADHRVVYRVSKEKTPAFEPPKPKKKLGSRFLGPSRRRGGRGRGRCTCRQGAEICPVHD